MKTAFGIILVGLKILFSRMTGANTADMVEAHRRQLNQDAKDKIIKDVADMHKTGNVTAVQEDVS